MLDTIKDATPKTLFGLSVASFLFAGMQYLNPTSKLATLFGEGIGDTELFQLSTVLLVLASISKIIAVFTTPKTSGFQFVVAGDEKPLSDTEKLEQALNATQYPPKSEMSATVTKLDNHIKNTDKAWHIAALLLVVEKGKEVSINTRVRDVPKLIQAFKQLQGLGFVREQPRGLRKELVTYSVSSEVYTHIYNTQGELRHKLNELSKPKKHNLGSRSSFSNNVFDRIVNRILKEGLDYDANSGDLLLLYTDDADIERAIRIVSEERKKGN